MHCKAHSFALQDIYIALHYGTYIHQYTHTNIRIYIYIYFFIHIHSYLENTFTPYICPWYWIHLFNSIQQIYMCIMCTEYSSMISPFTDHLEAPLKKRTGWRTACPQQWQLPWMTTTLNTAGSVKWEQYASMAFTQTFTFGKKPFQSGRGKGAIPKDRAFCGGILSLLPTFINFKCAAGESAKSQATALPVCPEFYQKGPSTGTAWFSKDINCNHQICKSSSSAICSLAALSCGKETECPEVI